MNEIESYNELYSICLNMVPPQKDLVVLGRRLVTTIECKCEVGKKSKDATLFLMNDIVVITTVREAWRRDG